MNACLAVAMGSSILLGLGTGRSVPSLFARREASSVSKDCGCSLKTTSPGTTPVTAMNPRQFPTCAYNCNCLGPSYSYPCSFPKPVSATFDGTCTSNKCNFTVNFSGTVTVTITLNTGSCFVGAYTTLHFTGTPPSCPGCSTDTLQIPNFEITLYYSYEYYPE